MGVWIFNLVLIGVFTSLYFVYGSTQAAMGVPDPVVMGQLFKRCHEAAVAELKKDTTLGATGTVSRNCSSASLTSPMAAGLDAPTVLIEFHRGIDIGIPAPARAVVTFLPATSNIKGISFNQVRAQIGNVFQGDPQVGTVINNGTTAYIETVVGVKATLPLSIPNNAVAMVTMVTS